MQALAALPRPHVNVPPVVTYLLVTVGAFVAYSAVRNVSPVDQLRGALSGQRVVTPRKINPRAGTPIAGVADGTAYVPDLAPAASFGAVGGASGSGGVVGPDFVPANLTPIGQGGHRLVAGAAAKFAAWQRAFGAPITVTDSYRSYAQQAPGYASDPNRFGSPGTSRHVRGEAVDVNLSAIGANPNGTPAQRATFARLYSTALATGWANPRGPFAANSDHAEPWHFQTVQRWS